MAISDDGRFVLAVCNDGEMADPAMPDAIGHLWLVDRRRQTNVLVNPAVHDPANLNPEEKVPMEIAISSDGSTVAFVGPAGNSYDGLPLDEDAIYVWRRGQGLENLTPGPYDPWYPYGFALSGDGSYLAFHHEQPHHLRRGPRGHGRSSAAGPVRRQGERRSSRRTRRPTRVRAGVGCCPTRRWSRRTRRRA